MWGSEPGWDESRCHVSALYPIAFPLSAIFSLTATSVVIVVAGAEDPRWKRKDRRLLCIIAPSRGRYHEGGRRLQGDAPLAPRSGWADLLSTRDIHACSHRSCIGETCTKKLSLL